jgi:hypothetical protein
MKTYGSVLAVLLGIAVAVYGEDFGSRAWELERKGDAAAARQLLEAAVRGAPADPAPLRAYAEFLDRHGELEARALYSKLLDLYPNTGNSSGRAAVAKRLVTLDLLAGDLKDARAHLAAYHKAGGTALGFPEILQPPKPLPAINIPGPLRSFARMAALSPDLAPEDLLSALARNVVTNGYQAAGNDGLDQTEYLKLVIRYLSQARELEKLTGADHKINIATCDSPQTADLLRVLGYRMRGGCGSEVVLETVNATRAFLTIDSGFPLADLETALRTNQPFVYDFRPAVIPVLYGPEYWMSAREKQSGDFIDFFLSDPSLCRLYLGMSKLDPDTAAALKEAIPVARIRAYAHVLDFYGAMFEIRGGKAVVPGGARSEKAWGELAGASPDKGAAFFEKLIVRDDGWLASYFDALLRASVPVRNYLTEPERLKRFYAALRGKVTSPGPARPVFRANTDMMLLTTRLRIDADGKPFIPGDTAVWRNLFMNHPHGKYDGKLTKSAAGWKDPDDVLEALFGLCRKSVENEPLKIFMALSDMNRFRAKPLATATVDRLARDYRLFGQQYPILGEAPEISDQTIISFLDTAQTLGQSHDQMVKADAIGSYQALVSLWQILCRQGSIAPADADSALSGIAAGFGKVKNSRDVFDAARASVNSLLAATKAPENVSAQDRLIDLMAGSAAPADSESHSQMVQDMIRIFESQRLVSIQSLFDLADNLERAGKGEKIDNALLSKLAARISEIQLPRAQLSTLEKNSLAFGYWSERHIENQRKVNLRAAIDKAGGDAEKLRDLRGQLTPFLRDSLVGLNYVHYAPPGAQILHTNPVFVRSHDFLGLQGANQTWRQTEVFGSGWPASAGGRLVGSLSGLPYALAEAEQNFLIPSREQALIWGDLVPQMILSATVPRWWNVTPAQLHWVNLHIRYGESVVAQSVLDAALRKKMIDALDRYAPPARVRKVEDMLAAGDVREALNHVVPSELFQVAATLSRDKTDDAPMAVEIRAMQEKSPTEISYAAISRAFGTPKPTLANTYRPELLNLRTFPTLMGYSSRIMAESWESSLLYYAALADEVHLSPGQLNLMIPAWTQQTVERIFATHLEDWPALLRSLRLVGDDVRQKMRKQTVAAAGGE